MSVGAGPRRSSRLVTVGMALGFAVAVAGLALALIAALRDDGIPDWPVRFTGDFDTADTSQWTAVQEDADGRVEVVADRDESYGRFEVRAGEERAEVYKDLEFTEGEDSLFTWRTRLARGFPAAEDEWQLVWQLHHAEDGGSPPVALEIVGESAPGRFLLRGNGATHDLPDGPIYWRGPRIRSDRWYDLDIRVHHSRDPTIGFVEVWLNGNAQTLGNGETRMYGTTLYDSYNYPKLGYYRSDEMSETGVVLHDEYTIRAPG
jgi:Polysaccharide lyase